MTPISRACRVGHHSTSDDSFAYRARQEVEDRKRIDNPLSRLRLFLESRGWWDAAEETALRAKQKQVVLDTFKRAEVMKHWELKEMFEDVYGGEEPWNLVSCVLEPLRTETNAMIT
jgi:2-oxoisovalerate dehydrogenase E1 component subunit alpha